MAFIPAVDCVRVTMGYRDIEGNQLINVYHLVKPGGFDDVDFVTIADNFTVFDLNDIAPVRSNTTGLETVTVLGLEAVNGRVYEKTIGPIQMGTRTGQNLPGNVTVAVSWRTGFSGRSNRGRTFHIGLTADMIVENALTAAAVTDLLTAYGNLLADSSLGPGDMAVVSYFTNGAPRISAQVTPILNWTLNTDLDSQRRRLNGRGR